MLEMLANVLSKLGATQIGGATLLEMREHEERTCSLPGGHVEEISAQLFERLALAIDENLIKVEVLRGRRGGSHVAVSTTSNVGFASSSVGIFVRVLPKVGTEQMLNLALLAEMIPPWSPSGAQVSPVLDQALIEWTLRSFEGALSRLLARGGLRNTHESLRQTLRGRIKGRLLVSPWIRNAVRGAPHLIPCEFPSLEIDNPANRCLLWATHLALSANRRLPNHRPLEAKLRQLQRQLSGVSLVKAPGRHIDVRTLPSSLRHYSEALVAAQMIIDAVNLGSNPGELESMALSIDMNVVYELAFYNGLRQVVASARRHDEWRLTLRSASGDARSMLMIPDIWVEGSQSDPAVVIDTKWKAPKKSDGGAELVSASESKTIRLQTQDIYQVTAYALEALNRLHAKGVTRCVGALVYPTLRDVPPLERSMTISEKEVLVRVVGWNIAASTSAEIARVWQLIRGTKEAEKGVEAA